MTNSDHISCPFSHLKIDESHHLDKAEGRTTCPKCSRSRKYFCYTCYCPVPRLEKHTPRVKLPLHIDIIKHPLERDGKSTACHAAVISPEYVHIHTFPDFPNFDTEKTVLVFPGKDAVQLEDLVSPVTCNQLKTASVCPKESPDSRTVSNGQACISSPQQPGTSSTTSNCDTAKQTDLEAQENSDVNNSGEVVVSPQSEQQPQLPISPSPDFNRVVFIDSTWNQVHGILQDERLKGLKKVELKRRHSEFWRHQKGSPPTYLSTIEAIYYFVRDYHELFVPTPYNGDYDNLLFFFSHLFEKVNTAKNKRTNVS